MCCRNGGWRAEQTTDELLCLWAVRTDWFSESSSSGSGIRQQMDRYESMKLQVVV